MVYDTVVIGSGIGGLSAAIMLAQEGQRVVIVEQARGLAPLLASYSRNGYRFDPGFHFGGTLDGNGLLSALFRLLGVWDRLEMVEFTDQYIRTAWPGVYDQTTRWETGLEGARASFADAFPQDAAACHGFFDAIDQVIAATPILDPRQGSMEFVDTALDELSLRQFVDELGGGPALSDVLCHFGTRLYGTPPELTSFRFHAMLLATMLPGLRRIKGGGSALVSALETRLDELGVEVRLGVAVEGLDVGDRRRLQGVRLADGDRFETSHCVAAIHPKCLAPLLSEGAVRPIYRRRLTELKESASFFTVNLGLSEPLPSLRQGCFDFMSRSNSATGALSPNGEIEDGLLLMTATEEGSAPTATLMRYAGKDEFSRWEGSRLGNRPSDYVEYKQEQSEALIARAMEIVPDIQGRIAFSEAWTPLTIEAYTGAPEGAAYGVAHRIDQRNPEFVTRVHGLFLSGQAVMAPGLCGAILASYIGCDHLVEGRIRRRLIECV